MDAQEFKTKYPHLSHLEGNDLWNAMEDAWMYEHKDDKPKVIADWKGNVVKPGDEICLIKIKDKSYFGKMGMMIPGKGIVWSDKEPEPDKDCWKVGEYSKVDENLCITTKHGDYTFTQPISICMEFIDTTCLILAIKGVSDMQTGSADR